MTLPLNVLVEIFDNRHYVQEDGQGRPFIALYSKQCGERALWQMYDLLGASLSKSAGRGLVGIHLTHPRHYRAVREHFPEDWLTPITKRHLVECERAADERYPVDPLIAEIQSAL